MPTPRKARTKRPPLPRTIWALGLVSMFMDISSELTHSLLPLFMVTTLGASAFWVGLVEGIAEATAMMTKVLSGVLSDKMAKRKLLVLTGYAVAALTKPLFPMAQSIHTVLLARFIDRIGKGIRGAPRDAMIADIVAPELRGAAFGLRQSLDSTGAFIGPLLAVFFMWLFSDNIRAVMWIAVIPAYIAVIVLIYGVREPAVKKAPASKSSKGKVKELRSGNKPYWAVVGIAAAFMMGRISEAFLVLKAFQVGMAPTWVPLIMVLMSFIYSVSAYPIGKMSDSQGRLQLLKSGGGLLIIAHLILAAAGNVWVLMIGVFIWGLHMGFTQGIMAAMVTDTAPPHLRGTAYGMFNLMSGIAMLAGSVLAGLAWDGFGPHVTFCIGALFTVVALLKLEKARPLLATVDLPTPMHGSEA